MIIGITGLNCSGKGSVVEFLKEKGFKHFSARALIKKEILERNLELSRDNYIKVANDLRKQFGPDYIAETLYFEAKNYPNSVIESLRTLSEVNSLRSKGDFVLLAVEADQKLRYQRAISRNSETDKISFEKFVEQELTEFSSSDEFKQNLKSCIELADYTIVNNGSFSDLKKEIEDFLKKWNTK